MGEALCLLLVGHTFGDFYFQSDKLASKKERSRTAMLHHCVLYAIGMAAAIAVLAYGLQCDLRAAALAWVALCLAHALVDFAVRPNLIRSLPGSLRPFACDQAIHLACCLGAALCIAPWCASELSAYWGDSLVWATSLLLTGAPVCVLVKLVLGDLRQSAQEPSDTTVKPGERGERHRGAAARPLGGGIVARVRYGDVQGETYGMTGRVYQWIKK